MHSPSEQNVVRFGREPERVNKASDIPRASSTGHVCVRGVGALWRYTRATSESRQSFGNISLSDGCYRMHAATLRDTIERQEETRQQNSQAK